MKGTLTDCVVVIFLVSVTAYSVLALHCYHCFSDEIGSPCETDVEELKQGVFSKYAINCTEYSNLFNPVCAIEIHKQIATGAIQKIFRSCSNGMDFNFDRNVRSLQKFQHLNADTNVTICGHYQNMICVSLCNTDMCNGPKGAILDFNRTSSCGKVDFTTLPLIIGTGITLANMNP